MFKVIGKILNFDENDISSIISEHYKKQRSVRNEVIEMIGYGSICGVFSVDRGHHNGKEYHIITSTGIIFIENEESRKLVTALIARPQQIRRYYVDMYGQHSKISNAVQKAMDAAEINEQHHLCMIEE